MSTPTRQVHVIAPGRLAGAERVVLEGCAALAAIGVDVAVVAIVGPGDPDGHGRALLAAAAARGTLGVLVQRRHLMDPVALWRLRETTALAHVVAHGAVALAMTRMVTSSARLTAMFHGFTSHTAGVRRAEAVEVAIAKTVGRVCAVSSPLRDTLVARGLRAKRVTVVENPVALRAPFPRHNEAPTARLAFVGRLSPEKNVHTLLSALAAMPAGARPDVDIVGDGPERTQLQAQAMQLGLTTVTFHGWRDDMDDVLSAVDAVVLPSVREGTPLVLLEAATRGLPFVASAVGGIPTLVARGAVGMLVHGVDTDSWQAALTAFVGQRAAWRAHAQRAMPLVRHQASPTRWAHTMDALLTQRTTADAVAVAAVVV